MQRHIVLLLLLFFSLYLFLLYKYFMVDSATEIGSLVPLVEKEEVKQECEFSFKQIAQGKALMHSENPRLINFIRNRVMIFPEDYKNKDVEQLAQHHVDIWNSSELTETTESKMKASKFPNNFVVPRGQHDQASIIDEILNKKRNGFYIEAGAWDGVQYSNSIFFEWERNWTGLLVEPNKMAFKKLITKGYRRNSVAVHGCLAVNNHSQEIMLYPASVYGRLVDNQQLPDKMKERMQRTNRTLESYPVMCYPLHSLLLALDNPVVDFFSLDVEGAELTVLETIPFQKVTIKLLLVEVAYSDADSLIRFMDSVGYKVLRRLELDLLFAPK